MLALYQAGFREALSVTAASGTYALLSPANAVPPVDAGVYYRVAPDVPITQVMFMGGIAVGLFGVLGLAAALRQPASARSRTSLRALLARGDGWLLRAVAVVLVAAGVAASWTAYSLAGTAKLTATGWEIPALHDTASDKPVPFVPGCTSGPGGFQVCVHPAFSGYLGDVAAALDPVAAEIAGLPGAPARAEQVASAGTGLAGFEPSYIAGNPPCSSTAGNRWAAITGRSWASRPGTGRTGAPGSSRVSSTPSSPNRRIRRPRPGPGPRRSARHSRRWRTP